ncbi:MAG: flavodoxin domain-containing protein [Candidatus Bathyarchaeota archaeon]|nr:flavodoxin domain-containing protein [Candidatus Bathyarchaeota archaeon]
MSPNVLIMYDSMTGNTEKLANAVAEGAKKVKGINVEIQKADSVDLKSVAAADAYAFGSPTHFSMMSGRTLSLLTRLYPIRDKMAGKPIAVFTTGAGGQVDALASIERTIGVFNPIFVKPGVTVEGGTSETDRLQAVKLGERLAKAALVHQRSR